MPDLLRFGLREGRRFFADVLRGKGPRVERALEVVRQNARRGDADSVLTVLDDFGRRESFLMNVGDRKGEILDEEVKKRRPVTALELGAFCGYSAIRMARLMREWDGHLDSVEVSKRNLETSKAMVAYAGLANFVTFHHGSAAEVIPGLKQSIDLVFIDHWKDLYLPDLRILEDQGLLRSGSVVIADNVGFFDAADYLDHVRNSGRYDSRYVESTLEYNDDLIDAVEVSIAK